MKWVPVTGHYGIIIRELSLKERRVSIENVFDLMEVNRPFAQGNGLISLGPHFGQEASEELVRRLESLGLKHVDDFFVFMADAPEWCVFAASLQ